MGLFKDIDRPATSASVAEWIVYASRKDPIGHRIHLLLSMITMASILLSSSFASITSTLLIGYSIVRCNTLWGIWRKLPMTPVILSALALYAWLAISISWSTEPWHGARLLRGSRYLLLIMALLPMMCHARILLWSIVAGSLIQFSAQAFDMAYQSVDSSGGLSKHPGFTALWFSLSLATLLYLRPGSNSAYNYTGRSVAAVLVVAGLVISVARSAILATSLGLIAGWGVQAIRSKNQRQLLRGAIPVLCILAACIGFTMQSRAYERVMSGFAQVTSPYEDGNFHMDKARFIYWKAGLEQWTNDPITGRGLGSAATVIAKNEEARNIVERDSRNKKLLRDDYHSLYVTVLADAGVVGALLLVTWLGLLLQRILSCVELTPILLVGFVTFVVYSFFNTTIFTGRLVAFSTILMAFSLIDLPQQVSIRDIFK